MKTTGAAAHTANKNRAARQEALREQLAQQCRVQHIIENINKIEDLGLPMDAIEVQRIKAANEARLKLLNKYLPDLKSTELTGADGGNVGVDMTWTIKVVE
jgi:hypothetical protein